MSLSRRPLVVHLSLLLTVVIWGQTFVAIRYLVVRIGAPEVLALRAGLSSLCFLVIVALSQRAVRRFTRAEWGRMALVALCGVAVNNVAQTFSQNYLTAALASLIVTCGPIFTAILSRLLLNEAMTRRKLLGIALACAGFLIVLLWGGSGASFSVDRLVGVAILICAPLGWATYTVLSKPLLARHEPHVVAGVTTVLGGLMLLPLLSLEPSVARDAVQLSARGWLAALTFSVLAIVVGYTLWYCGLRELDPSQVVVYMYLVPFFGVFSSWLILGEHITPWLLLGGAIILAGVIVTNSGRRPLPVPPAPAATPAERETVHAGGP
jgi:drug/metabolite transporter (DMT)-like permease